MRSRTLCRIAALAGAVLLGAGSFQATQPLAGASPAAGAGPAALARPTFHVLRTLKANAPIPNAGEPHPGPMFYNGGPVLKAPKVYLVLWGWTGANDPDNTATLLQGFLGHIGGSAWEGVVTQYSGITNPAGQLAGVWTDTTDPIHDNLTDLEIAQEAGRAVTHFNGTSGPDPNANYFVATPSNANTAAFNAGQYCAYHDYTNGTNYPGVAARIAFTNFPYVANLGASCGAGLVNSPGTTDGVTMAAGHEYLEAVTDPGAEQTGVGGWYDLGGDENGDKCAYVTVGPGSVTDVTLSDGKSYAVQGTWSNKALSGTGACATS